MDALILILSDLSRLMDFCEIADQEKPMNNS